MPALASLPDTYWPGIGVIEVERVHLLQRLSGRVCLILAQTARLGVDPIGSTVEYRRYFEDFKKPVQLLVYNSKKLLDLWEM
jgi:hypothetical protein